MVRFFRFCSILAVFLAPALIHSYPSEPSPLVLQRSDDQDHQHIFYLSQNQVLTYQISGVRTALIASTNKTGYLSFFSPLDLSSIGQVRLSQNPLEQLVFHPSEPLVAWVDVDQRGERSLKVYNLKTGANRYTRPLDASPLHLEFSLTGRYLAMSEPRPGGLVLIDTASWRSSTPLRNTTSIASFFTFSANEDRLMVYSPSRGRFYYYTIRDGSLLGEIQSLTGLSQLTMLQDRRFALGKHQGDLVLVNLISGAVVQRYEDSLALDPITMTTTDGFFAPSENFNGIRLQRVEASGFGSYIPGTALTLGNTRDIRTLIPLNTGFAAISQGSLVILNNNGSVIAQVQATHSPISGAVGSGETSLILQSDNRAYILSGRATRADFHNRISSAVETSLNIRNQNDVTAMGTNKNALFLVEKARPDLVQRLSLEDNTVEPLESARHFDVEIMEVYEDRVLIGNRRHGIKILDGNSLAEILFYPILGFTDANLSSNGTLLISQNAEGLIDSPLIEVDPVTLETTPIRTDDISVFSLARLGSNSGTITMGISQGRDGNVTTIRRFDPRTKTLVDLFEIRGEQLDGKITANEDGSKVLLSLGHSLYLYDGNRVREFRESGHVYDDVFFLDEIVVSVNRDGTIGLWSGVTLSFQGILVLSKDQRLLFVEQRGSVHDLSNPGSPSFLRLSSLVNNLIPQTASSLRAP